MSDFNWSKPEKRHKNRSQFVRPSGLRGKEIGLYYKNLQKKKENKEYVLNFSMPNAIMTKLQNDLKVIANIVARNNIILPENTKRSNSTKIKIEPKDPASTVIKKEHYNIPNTLQSSDDFVVKSTYLQGSNTNIEIKNEPGPSTSTTHDFIPVRSHNNTEYSTENKMLSIRGTVDYKYGYKDIITGSFEEKLVESISKGINISMVTDNIINIDIALHDEYKDMLKNSRYQEMLKFREKLPAYLKSSDLINVINSNQVVVISGETGCGKSTQVPQIILDDALKNNRGGNVNIIVTQPRRIAASSLAMRVSDERAERLGKSIGYAVRLEKVDARPRGSIMFCTTGILLADLEVNQGLTEYSHVILDEVHERDTHIDLSMCVLKQVLLKRKDLKLILMSATLDAKKLSAYFNNCPMVHIEGLAYPVRDIYLEDILQVTRFQLFEKEKSSYNSKKWMKHRAKGKISKEMEKDIQYKVEIMGWLESIKGKINPEVYATLQKSEIEELNIDLIQALLVYICKGDPGAILVFLPGIGDITKLLRKMTESKAFPTSQYAIYPLHSKLNSLEQHKIFERPPKGQRKIVVATNIAETSITIDDIVYVVDCGKIKMSGLNVEQNISTLKTEWISQANLRQRRGRSGRCQPGVCYHLLTSFRAQKLEERLLPELQRSDILEPVLTIKRLRLGKAADALMMVPDPPALSTVDLAVKHLQQCGALDSEETLTPLGWHLARLPVHPSAGKLLLLGALFGCLDRAASVAAVLGFKDPFMLVIGKEDQVKQAKRQFALGEPSDHVALSEAHIQWEKCHERGNSHSFAYNNFLSQNTLQLLSDMKKQLGYNLKQMGFLPSGDIKAAWENRNTNNLSLFKTVVAAALYPKIGSVRWQNLKRRKIHKSPRATVRTPLEGAVSLHPSSVMAAQRMDPSRLCDNPGANWLVYWMMRRSTDLFLFDVTLVYTLPLLFFGELKISDDEADYPDSCFISITSIKVRCKNETADMLLKLRSLLDHVLASKVMVSSEHSTRHSEFEELVLNSVIALVTAEDEQAEYLDSGDMTDSDTSDCSDSHRKRWH